MEPRGCIGDYNAADDHYTLHTGLQRVFGYRAELASKVLKVPESRIRVVTGDIGGSFGMKSPIFPESPLVLLASKLIGRPGEVDRHPFGFVPERRSGPAIT